MKIPALRIEVNGNLIAVAGAEKLSLLSGHVSLGGGASGNIDLTKIGIMVIGIDVASAQPQQLTWGEGVQLKPGDRITFEVVETEDPTPPSNARRTPSSSELASAALAEKRGEKKARR